jgi:site-specific DNA-adenine methylase
MGNKKNELERLLPIIELQLKEDTIYIEPFCGSGIVSNNIFKKHNIKTHINEIDELRIKFYNNMKDEEERKNYMT